MEPKKERARKAESGRGRDARSPRDIPWLGWRDILLRLKSQLIDDNVPIVSAGVAFFALLALFPAIAALMSIAGLVTSAEAIESEIAWVVSILPANAAEIVADQARAVASQPEDGASLAAAVGLLLSLFSASRGMIALMKGMNIAYDEEEKRNLIVLNATALVLTLFVVLGALVALTATIATPLLLDFFRVPEPLKTWIAYGRWPLLAVLGMVGLAVLNRYAPSRRRPRWRWVSVGAILATLLWIAVSIALSIYVRSFGNYTASYGALAGVIVLLIWLWLSAFAVLVGAKLNSEIEHQTECDTTAGKSMPRGSRGAAMADGTGRAFPSRRERRRAERDRPGP